MTESSPTAPKVELSIDNGIATVALNRPEVRNAIDDATRIELIAVLDRVANDDAVRAVVMTGRGGAFCAGGDVSGMQQRLKSPPGDIAFNGWRRERRTHQSVAALHGMAKPTIAAVDGPAVGLGCDMALCCDFIIASKTAMFSMSFINRGLIPDGGGMYFLPRRIGLPRAKEMIFTGRRVKADEALAMGLADRVTESATLLKDAQAWATELSRGSAAALALSKSILDKTFELTDEQVFALGREAQAICYTTGEHHEAVTAFLEQNGALDLMSTIGRLFQPRSVAVIGASADAGKLTGRPVAYLQKHRFAGQIYPVNPRYESIASLTCYKDVKALPAPPDVGIVLLGADHAIEAVRQLAAAGTSAAIVLASGFGEAGPEGKARQQKLREAAGTMRLLGPNTIGLVNLTDKITLSASGALDELEDLPTGKIAVVSQSGGILGSLLSRAAGRGIGLSKLVATGNEADLEVADFIDYLVDDDATAVIALYLEGLRNPQLFREVAAKAAQRSKPLVVFKVGRSESGVQSAISHTGALAGADRVYDALFQQVGAIRAATFADLLDIPVALAMRRKLHGNRVAVITSTGGAATLVADACGMAGLDLPQPDPATAARLTALDIRDATLDRNPIDVTLAGLRPDLFRSALDTVFESPTYDAAVVVVGSSGLGRPDVVAGPVIEALARSQKPLFVYVSPDAPNIVKHLNRSGVPAFSAPESCAASLSALLRTSAPSKVTAPPVTPLRAATGFEKVSGALNEAESKRLFAAFGVPIAKEFAVATPQEAAQAALQLHGPVVLKILSRQILHKTEAGGVMIGVAPADVARCCTEMRERIGAAVEGFLVQELVKGGAELILGFRRDPQLGPAILLGFGGVTAELFNDTAIRLPPVSQAEALEMIDTLKSSALLKGFRGRPRADIAALAAAIQAFSDMVVSLGDRLVEAEINPLFVLPAGQGARAADGLVVLS